MSDKLMQKKESLVLFLKIERTTRQDEPSETLH